MEGDDSHHLSPPDGLTESSLRPPCELCLCPAYDTTHIGYKVREERGIEGLSQRIDAQLVEDILSTRFFGGWTKRRTLEYEAFLDSTLHRECSRGDRLSRRGKLPLHTYRAHADDVLTLYSWGNLSIPSDHVLKFAVNGWYFGEAEVGPKVTYWKRIAGPRARPLPGVTESPRPVLRALG